MSEFDKAEAEDRGYFKQLYPNYKTDFSQDRFSWWDVSGYTVSPDLFDDTSTPYVAELKKRECKHNEFDTVLLQADKYDNLMNYTLQSGINTFYICYYRDKTLVYNISKIDLNKVEKGKWQLPVNSVADNGMKYKDVYLLPVADAKVLSRGWAALKKNIND